MCVSPPSNRRRHIFVLDDSNRRLAGTALLEEPPAEPPLLGGASRKVMRILSGAQHREATRKSKAGANFLLQSRPEKDRDRCERESNSIEEAQLGPWN